MSATVEDLLGAWRLEGWSLVYEDGRPPEYPLGPDAKGLIMYTADGHVAATLMKADRSTATPQTDAERATAYAESFAYAGRYELRDGTVFHSIEIATNPALIGIKSTRHIQLDGDRLILSGPDFAAGTSRTQRIAWRRAQSR
jgi:hypothetical protein